MENRKAKSLYNVTIFSKIHVTAEMVKLADTLALGASGSISLGGSSPLLGILYIFKKK